MIILTGILFLDIIHRLVHFLKNHVLEAEFCLRPQVKPTQLGPIDRASPYLWTFFFLSIGPNWVGFTWGRRQLALSIGPNWVGFT
jgi:hypothetical protein